MRAEDLRLTIAPSPEFMEVSHLTANAARARNQHIEPAHWLLGLAHSSAPNVFDRLGLNNGRRLSSQIAEAVDFSLRSMPSQTHPIISEQSLMLIEHAQTVAAETYSHNHLYPGHLLYSLLVSAEPDGVLKRFGADVRLLADPQVYNYVFTEAEQEARRALAEQFAAAIYDPKKITADTRRQMASALGRLLNTK